MKAELKSHLKTREQKWAEVTPLQFTRNHAGSARVVLVCWFSFYIKAILFPEPST